jgi:hypothetical protein
VVSYRLQYDVCLPTTHSAIAVHEYPPCPEPKSSYRFEYESIPLTFESINTVKLYCALPRPKCILFASHTICAGSSDTSICPHHDQTRIDRNESGFMPIGLNYPAMKMSKRWVSISIDTNPFRPDDLHQQATYWCSDADAFYLDSSATTMPYNGLAMWIHVLLILGGVSFCGMLWAMMDR